MDQIEKIIRVAKIIKKETSILLGENKKKITYSQHIVLQAIFQLKETTSAEIADYIKKDRSTTAEIVRRLIQKEVLVRKENPKDKRSYLVSLSEQSNKKIKELNEAKKKVFKVVFKDVSKEELKTLEKILDKIILGGLDEKY